MKKCIAPKLIPVRPCELTPTGWLYRQLKIQAEGLSGNLDRVWPDVRDSRWFGGDREGWERVPYWLDGFIPLAYLLRDEDMIARARRYVDAIVSAQKPDGWICPCDDSERTRYDTWAAILIAKTLTVYYECSREERIIEVVRKILYNLYLHLRGTTLFNWGAARSYELMISINWLYDKEPADWLLELAVTSRVQGFDYGFLFDHWRDQEPRSVWSYQTHIVNLAMMLKYEAVYYRITGSDGNAKTKAFLAKMDKYHGGAAGYIAGDECLAGRSPIHGVELCAIVESMYSYEVLYAITGDAYWLTRLEKLAYNALPATNSEDMWTHQYLQLSNQTTCELMDVRPLYYTNGPESNRFGLEPNYGCCTANFSQGWPKFALSAFMREGDDTIVAALTLPMELDTELRGVGVHIACVTDYPFSNRLSYTVRTDAPVSLTLKIHVPENCAAVSIDGVSVPVLEGFVSLTRTFAGETTVAVAFVYETRLRKTTGVLSCVEHGPLLYALPIPGKWERLEFVRDGIERKFPYCDYNITPEGKWNYGFAGADFAYTEHGVGVTPFSESEPPVTLEAVLCEIDWPSDEGHPRLCAAYPASTRPIGEPCVYRLIPYGCTTLRMTEMPLCSKLIRNS